MDIGFEFVVTPKENDKINDEINGQTKEGERKSEMTYAIQIISDNVDNWQVEKNSFLASYFLFYGVFFRLKDHGNLSKISSNRSLMIIQIMEFHHFQLNFLMIIL
jgi:hypothetical protein